MCIRDRIGHLHSIVFQQLPVAAEGQALGGPGGNALTGLFGDLLGLFQSDALFLSLIHI